MRIRNRVWTAPDGACGSDDASDEGFEEKEGGRFLMPLIAAALDAERDFEAENKGKASQKKISGNVRGNGWRDLLLSWKDTGKRSTLQRMGDPELRNVISKVTSSSCALLSATLTWRRVRFRTLESFLTFAVCLLQRDGIANPKNKREVSTLSTSSRDEHNLLSICPHRCSAKQKPSKASASSPTRDVAESSKCSIDLQCSKKRKANTSDSAEKKNPKRSELEIAKTDTRCKRRNGKGWRCSGTRVREYSLCEHHLSKTQAQPSKNKKKKTTKVNVLDAGSGFHAPPAVDGVDNSAQKYAYEDEQQKARSMEMELQVKKQRKKKSLKDINSVLDHDHPHNHHHPDLIRDFTFELRE